MFFTCTPQTCQPNQEIFLSWGLGTWKFVALEVLPICSHPVGKKQNPTRLLWKWKGCIPSPSSLPPRPTGPVSSTLEWALLAWGWGGLQRVLGQRSFRFSVWRVAAKPGSGQKWSSWGISQRISAGIPCFLAFLSAKGHGDLRQSCCVCCWQLMLLVSSCCWEGTAFS